MSPDRYEEWDASYVLGALSDAERLEFEAHLPGCAECRRRVAEVHHLPALLADVPEAAFAVLDPPPPDGLFLALQREVRSARQRRRWLYSGVAAAAAAALILTTALITRESTGSPANTVPAAAGRPMTNVSHAPLHVDAVVTNVAWGTLIDLRCQYSNSVTSDNGYQYGLVVIDKSGVAHPAGTWAATPGQVTTFSGGTSLKTTDIASIDVTRLDGTTLLTLAP